MDGEHFTIIGLVVSFRFIHGLRVVGNWVPEIVIALLEENSAGCVTRCIDFEVSGLYRIKTARIGSEVNTCFKASKVFCWGAAQVKGVSFLVRSCKGRASFEKSLMNRQ